MTENEIMASPSALQAITSGEIDMQVSTARRYPRSIAAFKADALSMACLDVETAESCFYALKRDGKTIEGPGVRLAEIVASCWGNLRVEARVIGDDGRFVTAQGTCWDMERNVLVRTEVRRRVTGSSGKRYSDDMVGVTSNAAASIAVRNAIFKVVPTAFVRDIYEKARACAVGDERTLSDRRARAFGWAAKAGVGEARVLEFLGRSSVEDCGLGDLSVLQGIRTAVQEGTTTLDEAFAKPEAPAAVGKGMAGLRARVTPAAPAAPETSSTTARVDETTGEVVDLPLHPEA